MAGVSDPVALLHTQLILFLTAGVREGFLDPVRLEMGFEGQENFHKDARGAMRLDGAEGGWRQRRQVASLKICSGHREEAMLA